MLKNMLIVSAVAGLLAGIAIQTTPAEASPLNVAKSQRLDSRTMRRVGMHSGVTALESGRPTGRPNGERLLPEKTSSS